MLSDNHPPETPNVPVVSVIIIFYNAEKFLAEAIESVLGQEFTDWELLLVDDGSSDTGTKIALEFVSQHPARIRYIQHMGGINLGESASRNLGIEQTRAPLIAFLDADDVWMPTKLADQVAIMSTQPVADIVFGHTKYWYGWTGIPKDIKRDYIRHCAVYSNVLIRPPFNLINTFLEGLFPSPSMSSVMLRRECLDRVGGFDETYNYPGVDTVFFVKVFLNCYAYYADACWDWYRQHPDSFTATTAQHYSQREVGLNFMQWVKSYFTAQGVTNPYLLKAIDENLLLGLHPFKGRLRLSYIRRKAPQVMTRWLRNCLSLQQRAQLRRVYHVVRRPWLFLVRWLRLRWLWRVTPVHPEFGCYYGKPVDRYYIEEFLAAHRKDIQGCVLEVGEATYTTRYGAERVTKSEVLHAIPGNPVATVVADITNAPHIPSDHYDCIIFTQTLQCIYDFHAALRTLHRILKPGGVLLITIPGVAHQISREERPYWGDFWRWTTMSAERMFHEVFPPGHVRILARGNVLTSVALLHGLVIEELRASDFTYDDPEYELSIGIRASKPSNHD